MLGLSIAGANGLFLLGNYGVKGESHVLKEEYIFTTAIFVGLASLLITAILKGLIIEGEINRDGKAAAVEGGSEEGSVDKEYHSLVLELRSFWVGLGVVATTIESPLVLLGTVIRTESYISLSVVLLPLLFIFHKFLHSAQKKRPEDDVVY